MKYWLAAFVAAVVIAIGLGLWFGGWSVVSSRQVPVSQGGAAAEPSSPPAAAPLSAAAAPSVAATAPSVAATAPPVPSPPAVVTPPSPSPPMKAGGPVAPAAGVAPGTPPAQASADLRADAVAAIDKIGLMFRDYRTLMGTNPVGTNAEIIQAVNGGNPRNARLGPPEGQQLNGKGELVDPWGTPYFFHQQSATNMEIHSAGPDQAFGTPDDIFGR